MNTEHRRAVLAAAVLLLGPLSASALAQGRTAAQVAKLLGHVDACRRLLSPLAPAGALVMDRRAEPDEVPAELSGLGAASAAFFASADLHDCRSQWEADLRSDEAFHIKPEPGRWREVEQPGFLLGGGPAPAAPRPSRTAPDVVIRQTPLDRSGGMPLCAGEKYRGRPRGAYCSGTLVGPDLVLTAAHCFTAAEVAEGVSIVFGYGEEAAKRGAVSHTQVYRLKEVVASELGESLLEPDWALVRLDRPVAGGKPLTLEPAEPAPGAPVATMGYPQGLPLKFDPGGRVVSLDLKNGMLGTDLSVFGGNSGGPVLDAAGRVVAVVDTAVKDAVPDPARGCAKANVIQDPARVTALASLATLTRTVLRHPAAGRALGRAGARSLDLDPRGLLGSAGKAAGALGAGPVPGFDDPEARQVPVPGRPGTRWDIPVPDVVGPPSIRPDREDRPAAPPALRPGDLLPPAAQPPSGWRLTPDAPPQPRKTPVPGRPGTRQRGWWERFEGMLGADQAGTAL